MINLEKREKEIRVSGPWGLGRWLYLTITTETSDGDQTHSEAFYYVLTILYGV